MTLVVDPAADAATDPAAGSPGPDDPPRRSPKRPLYWRLLRLRHIHPNAWQRALLGEGAIAVAVILVLADRASAWILVVFPLTVAAVVKAHDLLAGLIAPVPGAQPPGEKATAPPEGDAVVDEEEA